MTYENQTLARVILVLLMASAGRAQTAAPGLARQGAAAQSQTPPHPPTWESPARLRHGLIGGTSGTLRADSEGVEFVPLKGASLRWTFAEIKDLDLERHRIVLIGYDNRRWNLPGTRRFELEIRGELPPTVAASLAEEIGKPARNRMPDPQAPAIAVIGARRSKGFRGNNGLLRIRQLGIDYVTAQPGQSRSWSWRDLQTLSRPDPYHLLVFGYRDSYAFDLKGTLSREVFNQLSDEIWSHNESDVRGSLGTYLPVHQKAKRWRKDE
jgi:hypothetical protein